jgi:hypothetical protein
MLVVREGTHYTAVEYPELVGLRIERFFREHRYQRRFGRTGGALGGAWRWIEEHRR